MKVHFFFVFFAVITPILFSNCKGKADPPIEIQTDGPFSDYWFSGQAEITTYKLEQGQYGTTYPGTVTLIFVTEEFDPEKQVKPDMEDVEGQETLTIFKMIKTKEFQTGIYPYSKMSSVFSPIEGQNSGRAIKISSGAMEWCGQYYAQWNLRGQQWEHRSFSYFERQGDQSKNFERVWQEDELWSLIRLAPDYLPTDTFEIIAGNFNLRDRIARPEVHSAHAHLRQTGDGMSYELYIPAINRRLRIAFEEEFPHRILSWEEEFFSRQERVVHKASRYRTTRIDYWNHNRPQDQHKFEELMPGGFVSTSDTLNTSQ